MSQLDIDFHRDFETKRRVSLPGLAHLATCSQRWVSSTPQVKLCLGYFARAGFSGWGRREQDMEPQTVEITDTRSWRVQQGKALHVVVDSLFPRPMRFREVWKQVGTDGS